MSSPIISDSSSFATCNSCRIGVKSLLSAVIERAEEMGRRRYQKPSVMRTKAHDSQWYFRARMDAIGPDGMPARIEKFYYLGHVADLGKRQAERMRDDILTEAINKPGAVLQSQILFGRVLDEF